MTTYSHTRLGAFQECRYRYKLRYFDKVKVDVADTIEAFMGKLVHAALEKLYKDLQFQKLATKEELLASFDAAWDRAWDDRIRIVKPEYTAANYRAMGRKFIAEYYDHYAPFDGPRTVGLETDDILPLSNGHAYSVRIDRLCCDANGVYYVCDYKTNSRLNAQEELDEDRQLAMYSLWVRSRYSDCRDVKLVWYFLAFDKELVSERNDTQLAALKASTEALIDEVEKCQAFPTTVSSLCSWCEFKSLCPAWKHGEELKGKPPEAFSEDEGVKLVDAYAALSSQKKLLDEDLEKVRERLIAFAKRLQSGLRRLAKKE